MKRLLSRLGQGILLLFVLSMLIFLFAELAPGDYYSAAILDSRMSEELVETLRARYGLDQSLPVRYQRWLASVARGEGGYSLAHRRPVFELLAPRVGRTLTLTVTATAVAWILALAVGMVGAYRPGSLADRLGMVGVAGLSVVPELLLALAGVWLAVHTGLPLGGAASLDAESFSSWERFIDQLKHLLLPVSILVLASFPPLAQHVRAAGIEALRSPHLRAARGHGIGGRRLFFAYVLPAAANPLVTLFGFSFGALLSGSLLIEGVLGWPGIGPLAIEAVMSRDLHVLAACVSAGSALLILGNLLADLALLVLDPRPEP